MEENQNLENKKPVQTPTDMHVVYLLYVNSAHCTQKTIRKYFFSFPLSLITICNYIPFQSLRKLIVFLVQYLLPTLGFVQNHRIIE